MESQRCVPRSRDEHKAIRSARESAMAISRPLLTVFTCTYRKVTQHGDQEQELKEEHGEEASSEDAEGEATGKEGQEVAEGRSWAIARIRSTYDCSLNNVLRRNQNIPPV